MSGKLKNITLNGKPLASTFAVARREPSARTKRGRVVFSRSDQKQETHVIIAGHVFEWHAKAPYVDSGKSVHGAIEYSPAIGCVKCHVCGGWFRSVYAHVARLPNSHGSVESYKATHGLRLLSSLSAPDVMAKRIEVGKARPNMRSLSVLGLEKRRVNKISRCAIRRPHQFAELNNLNARCKAQISKRIVELAAHLRHAPTVRELNAIRLYRPFLVYLFGCDMRQIYESLGLRVGCKTAKNCGRSDVNPSRVVALRRSGLTLAAVASQMRISVSTARRLAREYMPTVANQ